jgi:hypothetical protein
VTHETATVTVRAAVALLLNITDQPFGTGGVPVNVGPCDTIVSPAGSAPETPPPVGRFPVVQVTATAEFVAEAGTEPVTERSS